MSKKHIAAWGQRPRQRKRVLLDRDAETALILAWQRNGDSTARSRLLLAYKPLAERIAKQFLRPGLRLEDLVAEGMVGMMHALEKFDSAAGVQFGTFARWYVLGACKNHAHEFSTPVRLYRSKYTGASQILKHLGEAKRAAPAWDNAARERFASEHGITVSQIEHWEYVTRQAASVEQMATELVSEPEDIDGALYDAQVSGRLQAALGTLTEHERIVVQQRYLAVAEDRKPYHVLAEEFGIGRNAIAALHKRAIEKLQAYFVQHPID